MDQLIVTFSDLFIHIRFLLGVISFLLLLFGLTFNTNVRIILKLESKEKLRKVREYILIILLLFVTTLIYLVIDTHIIRLPDPIILYGFYTLGFTILFGVRAALLAGILAVILIEYYLYEPRYTLAVFHHPINVLYFLFVIAVGLLLGQAIRQYQQKLVKKTEDLDLLIKARDQFSAIAVHELKTPLTTISLYSQVLNKQYKNEKASRVLQDSVQTISHETDKLTYMINDLLDFSRFRSNKFALNPEVFNLAQLCKERVKVAQSLYPDHEYIFKQNLKNTIIYADRVAIDRVITNLLTNAGKYSKPRGKVITKLKKKNKEYILSVKDQGVGIEAKHLEKLFEPFYQAESGKKGLGLGLHIARSIVEFHNGRIWVESKTGKGSTFFVSLPFNFKELRTLNR